MEFNKDYMFDEKNYNNEVCEKTQIIIGNTLSTDLNHINKWKNTLNGECKHTSPFTVSRSGVIYMHYDPKYYSDFINIKEFDRHSIPIVLENVGPLWENIELNVYNTYFGSIYNEEHGVHESKWRNRNYWASYTDEQINSLVTLCHYLCNEFSIPLEVMESNTLREYVINFKGIAFRSNYSKYYYDVSPAFKINDFVQKLNKNGKQQ